MQLGKDKDKDLDVVLIVDDEDAEVYLCESILNYMYGFEDRDIAIITAYDSDSVQKTINSGVYIDLVLMDINLATSSLNGIQLVKHIRNINGDNPPPTIGMLTTSNRENDLLDSIEASADFYLEKTEDIHLFEESLKAIKNFYLDIPSTVTVEGISKYFSYIRQK